MATDPLRLNAVLRYEKVDTGNNYICKGHVCSEIDIEYVYVFTQ